MNRLIRTELLKQRTTRSFIAGLAAAPVVAGFIAVAILSLSGKEGNDPLSSDSGVLVMRRPLSTITT